MDLRPSIGITTGQAFCGVVGSRGRREYSVLGDTVNLSARLMQHATVSGSGVLCETKTAEACARASSHWHPLSFYDIQTINVKGKSVPIKIWKPILKDQPPHAVNLHLQQQLHSDATKEDFNGDVEMQRCRDILRDLVDSNLPKNFQVML